MTIIDTVKSDDCMKLIYCVFYWMHELEMCWTNTYIWHMTTDVILFNAPLIPLRNEKFDRYCEAELTTWWSFAELSEMIEHCASKHAAGQFMFNHILLFA